MTTQPSPPTRQAAGAAFTPAQPYEHEETRALVALVDDAAELVRTGGEAAFAELRAAGGRWRRGEAYVLVLDPDGTMLVHPDPAMEGKNLLDLKDVGGKPIVRGLVAAATRRADRPEGWYHYRWPPPGALLPRWKSSFVRLVTAPSGRRYVVGGGTYDDRMERAFVVDLVTSAVAEIETRGKAAFALLRDPAGPFLAKDAYVFVTDLDGVEIVNPGFPNLEGRKLLDVTDAHGRHPNREMIQVVRTHGAGWVDYLWPKPGESVATRKSVYVSRATLDGRPVMVGCGVYLADAPTEAPSAPTMTAPELMTLVRDAAALLERQGERAYAELRVPGSRWFRGDSYLFVLTMDGTRAFHAAEPHTEGWNDSGLRDVLGRPIVRMILGAGAGPAGEGWVHYMYPEPRSLFPAWKSTFVKRVTFPSGRPHVVGSGIYGMRMDEAFIEDVVDRAAALIGERGAAAFDLLRDRTGPFVFMDTYVFVHDMDGVELVNPLLPGLEGRNLIDHRDVHGRAVVREQIAAVMRSGSAWLECHWFKPGDNRYARKRTYVRRVDAGLHRYVVGSGIYVE